MTRFAAKTIAAFAFFLSAAYGCGVQAGQYDHMSDDEYNFLLSIGAIEETPMPQPPATPVVAQPQSQPQTQNFTPTRNTHIQGLSGTDLGSSRIKGLSGTDLGSSR